MAINAHQIKHFIRHYFTAKRNGHGIHSPFAYRLCEDVFYNNDSFYDLEALKITRNQLVDDETEITIEDFGAGSKTFKGNSRKIKDIAAKGISTIKQSETLYKLLNFLNCKSSVELGTSIGLNTLYLAKANAAGQVITIEGSAALVEFAKNLAARNEVSTIQFIQAKFDEALPQVLEHLTTLDFFYVDGNHTHTATIDYFNLALKKKHNATVFIFDDIYWSPGMTKAWQEIKLHPEVTLSIDTFYFGLVFFKPEIREKIELKLKL